MPYWKQFLLSLYYRGTYPYRRHRFRCARNVGRNAIAVVIFHRIADDGANPWTTSTRTFQQAIRWLQSHFDLISLTEAQRRLRMGRNVRPSVCVTFDDGYAINCQQAIPLLVRWQIPCTYFVSTGPVLSGEPFPHDTLMGNRFQPNSVAQLKEMARAGIEIGAHTRTHADLGSVRSSAVLFDELVAARDDLARAIDLPIRYFAFPFGRHENLSADAFQLAKEAGFAGVCSAYGGYNYPGDDAFHLQRCGVDGGLSRLKNWTTIDPIRNRRISRFAYRTVEADASPDLKELAA